MWNMKSKNNSIVFIILIILNFPQLFCKLYFYEKKDLHIANLCRALVIALILFCFAVRLPSGWGARGCFKRTDMVWAAVGIKLVKVWHCALDFQLFCTSLNYKCIYYGVGSTHWPWNAYACCGGRRITGLHLAKIFQTCYLRRKVRMTLAKYRLRMG